MNTNLYLWLLVLLCICSGEVFAQTAPLHYDITPVFDVEKPYLRVAMSYRTDKAQKSTVFTYPDNHWGQKELWNCKTNKKLNGMMMAERDSNRFTVVHQPGIELRHVYQIAPDQHTPLQWNRSFRPVVESGCFHVFGFALFPVPDDYWENSQDVKPVSIRWNGPESMQLASSFFTGRPGLYTINVTQLQLDESVFTGGDIAVQALPVGADTVFLASKTFEHLNMDSVGMLLQSAVSEQRSFWKETQPYYLVSLFPTYDEWNDTTHSLSVGGSGLHQSFTCMASDVPSPDLMERLTYLFFHEMMHNWIGGTIKSADEERQYWFTEGFTEYFQTKLRLRSGVLSVDQFLDEINESTLKPYYASPVREMPNDSMTYQNFWSNYHYEKLPYQRGLLFALLLDISAKQEAGISLDDAMFNILSYARRYPDLRMNDERLLEHIEEAFGYSITPTYQKYIAQGQSIDWSIVPLPEGLSAERDADGVIQFALEPERSEEVGVFLKR